MDSIKYGRMTLSKSKLLFPVIVTEFSLGARHYGTTGSLWDKCTHTHIHAHIHQTHRRKVDFMNVYVYVCIHIYIRTHIYMLSHIYNVAY